MSKLGSTKMFSVLETATIKTNLKPKCSFKQPEMPLIYFPVKSWVDIAFSKSQNISNIDLSAILIFFSQALAYM